MKNLVFWTSGALFVNKQHLCLMSSVRDLICNLFRNAQKTPMNMTRYDKVDYLGP